MKSKEAKIQSACINWFRLQYPKLKNLLFAVPNGGSRNVIEAKNLKRQGVLPGVSDLIFLVSSSKYPYLCIEMKHGKGRQSENQKRWQEEIEKAGGKYIICNSLDQFIYEINSYLKN